MVRVPFPEPLVDQPAAGAVPLWFVTERDIEEQRLPDATGCAVVPGAWCAANDFRGERQRVLPVPASDGTLAGVLVGCGRSADPEDLAPVFGAALAERLPAGTFRIASELGPVAATALALGFGIGCYRYTRYRKSASPPKASLCWPRAADRAYVRRAIAADRLARDLINTPAADLGPAELAVAIASLADRTAATYTEIVGDDLLTQGYPAVHAVGRAASAAPRVCELRHGEHGPRVTLIGTGVCFDTGGLDLKPSSAMGLMKKDMGGAACVLALAQMLIDARVPVRLRVIVPVVENSVSAAAFRPGDVLRTRKGLTVEVGNTDAEGRLILADALAAAMEEGPDLVIDLATLTGAARVALGAELPAAFSGSAALLAELQAHAELARDPLWPLPLWDGYDDELASKIADLCNVSSGGQAGAIIAALFLRRFVSEPAAWLHVDLYPVARRVPSRRRCARCTRCW